MITETCPQLIPVYEFVRVLSFKEELTYFWVAMEQRPRFHTYDLVAVHP